MFQLIVAVVSIALVIILTIAAIYFGGPAYTESKNRAMYAEYVNVAAQIDGAMQLYYQDHMTHIEGDDDELLDGLIAGGYLNGRPNGPWRVNSTDLYKPLTDASQCEIMNRIAGYDTSVTPCPACGSEEHKKWPGCMIPAGGEEG